MSLRPLFALSLALLAPGQAHAAAPPAPDIAPLPPRVRVAPNVQWVPPLSAAPARAARIEPEAVLPAAPTTVEPTTANPVVAEPIVLAQPVAMPSAPVAASASPATQTLLDALNPPNTGGAGPQTGQASARSAVATEPPRAANPVVSNPVVLNPAASPATPPAVEDRAHAIATGRAATETSQSVEWLPPTVPLPSTASEDAPLPERATPRPAVPVQALAAPVDARPPATATATAAPRPAVPTPVQATPARTTPVQTTPAQTVNAPAPPAPAPVQTRTVRPPEPVAAPVAAATPLQPLPACGQIDAQLSTRLSLARQTLSSGKGYAALAYLDSLNLYLPESQLLRADAYRRIGQDAEAETIYRQLLGSCLVGYAYHGLGLLESSRGKLALAQSYLEQAQQALPLHAGLRNDLGYLYLQRGNFQAAHHALMTAIELDPNDKRALNNLVLAYAARGDVEGARRIAARASLAEKDIAALLAHAAKLNPAVTTATATPPGDTP